MPAPAFFNLAGLPRMICRTRTAITVVLVVLSFFLTSLGVSQPIDGENGLWLEGAQITIRYRSDGRKEVRQRLEVRSRGASFQGRVEHRLFLFDSERISDVTVESDRIEGDLRVEEKGQGLEKRLWVEVNSVIEDSFSYELGFDVKTDDPSRCPLAVPLMVPNNPHSPVRIEIELPQGKIATGMRFPNLRLHEKSLIGEMGGIPTFVNVPLGEPNWRIWWARHGVDVLVLILIAVSIGIWMRYRERLARAAKEGNQ